MTAGAPRLELRGIEKRFGSVQALRGADFTLAPGEVHALLGENGAGKSTLMHVAYGLAHPDAGEVLLDGVPRVIHSPRTARRLGIGMVHQHFTAVPALTVAENVALAAGWRGRPQVLRARVRELAERVGLSLDPDARADSLAVALRQRLEIVKALAGEARVLLLDEPTGVLAPAEVAELFRVVREFAAGGGAVVLITHKLHEALDIADRVTVLRRGVVTSTGAAAGRTADELAAAMLGAGTEIGADRHGGLSHEDSAASGTLVGQASVPVRSDARPALVRLESLDVPRPSGYGFALRQGSLTVFAGEIVGIAAVEGNGQRELLRAVAGLVEPLRGVLDVTGPAAFIPEDRTREGLIPELTITENLVLGLVRSDTAHGERAPVWLRGRRIDWGAARRRAAEAIEQFGIRAPGPDTPVGALSGGNQQKLVVARALERAPRVLVAENPTRGLDVSATASVHDRLRAAAANGAAVLVHSSDLDEVLELATRVVVVADGVVHDVAPGASRAVIGELMLRARQPA